MPDAMLPNSGPPGGGDLVQVGDLIAASRPLPGGWLGQQLQRLQRLLALRDVHATLLNDEGRRLLDHAIFTTFVDCRELGGEGLASALLTTLAEDAPPVAELTPTSLGGGRAEAADAPAADAREEERQRWGLDPPPS